MRFAVARYRRDWGSLDGSIAGPRLPGRSKTPLLGGWTPVPGSLGLRHATRRSRSAGHDPATASPGDPVRTDRPGLAAPTEAPAARPRPGHQPCGGEVLVAVLPGSGGDPAPFSRTRASADSDSRGLGSPVVPARQWGVRGRSPLSGLTGAQEAFPSASAFQRSTNNPQGGVP